jgi:salicylate hydroxylase
MAYRMTIPRERIEQLNDSYWTSSLRKNISRNWWGPYSHAVFYPVRNKTVWNLVLVRADDLPPDTMTAAADVAEMKSCFEGWDPKLKVLLQCVDSCLKWKICHMSELKAWTKDSVALLGDACHPTLPYQAQGAAMAVEDGAAIGILIGSLSQSRLVDRKAHVPDILRVYEEMRKRRTTTNVQGAIENRNLFQMADERDVEIRNKELLEADLTDINKDCRWGYANLRYQKQLMGFDIIKDAREQFQAWVRTVQ